LVCNNSIHSIHCPNFNNTLALKGASAVVNNQPKQYVFNQNECDLLAKSLELCRYFIGKNQAQYQNPKDILNELSTSINIINARQNNNSNLKGASNICNKKEHLTDLLKQFNLI
jgi:hypothetical protein